MEKNQGQDPESMMNIPDFIFDNLVSVFWVKNTLMLIRVLPILDPGWKKIGFEINIPDPQYWMYL
jgi:hypothetical protein